MLAYDADLELFRDNFKRFLNEHIAPHYEQWEQEGIMPRSIWNLMGENGFLCIDVPEEYGGYGVPTHYSLMLVEESARAGYSALSTGISCHSEIAAPYILHIGTEEQKQYWLPKMVSGEVVGAIGMTEPGAGSDLQAMRTNAILQGDHYLLNGSKTFISNGQHADLVVLAVKTDPQARAKGVSLMLLDTHLEIISWLSKEKVDWIEVHMLQAEARRKISKEYLHLCQRKNMSNFNTKFSTYKRTFRSNLKILDQNKFDLFCTHDNKMYMVTKFSD